MNIDVLITSCGRKKYLDALFQSIADNCKTILKRLNVILVLNETDIDIELQKEIGKLFRNLEIINEPKRKTIDRVLGDYAARERKSTYLWKLDEDALLVSKDFGVHLAAILEKFPAASFSPFPVGLINNLGGPKALRRQEAVFVEKTDTYYTIRFVEHVGGFCRICPSSILNGVRFDEGHTEDTIVSGLARAQRIPMFYLENALIVEHQESTVGQHERYGATYFKDRF